MRGTPLPLVHERWSRALEAPILAKVRKHILHFALKLLPLSCSNLSKCFHTAVSLEVLVLEEGMVVSGGVEDSRLFCVCV